MSSNYDINNIKHLKTKEAMRKNINVYLGSKDTEGIYQSLKEVINNSTDEALAGFGNVITIEINEEINSIVVTDEGRGCPFGIREDGENVLVSIVTQAHTGGKFDKGAYQNSSGLHGLGLTAVCMSSEKFTIKSTRDKVSATASFIKGELIDYKEEKTSDSNGTIVSFTPDKEVFTDMTDGFSYNRICEEIKAISYLNKGIKFIVKNGKTEKIFYSENGIADFIMDTVKKPLMRTPIFASAKDNIDEIEIAFMWTNDEYQEYVFVNGLYCPESGSPSTGAKTTITSSIKRLVDKNLTPELIRKGLVFVINCKVLEPSFANQTKTKITNPNLRTLAAQAFKDGMEQFSNCPEFGAIAEMMKRSQKAEAAADRAREAVLNHTKEMNTIRKDSLKFFKKLSDAENLGEGATLWISEGKDNCPYLLYS